MLAGFSWIFDHFPPRFFRLFTPTHPQTHTKTGTTRIPKVREMLRQHLHVESLNTRIDPDITVAVGAACVVD